MADVDIVVSEMVAISQVEVSIENLKAIGNLRQIALNAIGIWPNIKVEAISAQKYFQLATWQIFQSGHL